MATASASATSPEKEVTREDQERINKFGRMTVEMHEMEELLKYRQDELSAVQDAQSEALLAEDDGAIKLMVGETYFDLTPDAAVDTLGKRETALQTEIDSLTERLADLKSQLAQLKAKLYAKFGRDINLDED